MFCSRVRALMGVATLALAAPAMADSGFPAPNLSHLTPLDAYDYYADSPRSPKDVGLGVDGTLYAVEGAYGAPLLARFNEEGAELPPIDVTPDLIHVLSLSVAADGAVFMLGDYVDESGDSVRGIAFYDPASGATEPFARHVSLPQDALFLEAAGTEHVYCVRTWNYGSEVWGYDRSGQLVSEFTTGHADDIAGNDDGTLAVLITERYWPGWEGECDERGSHYRARVSILDGTGQLRRTVDRRIEPTPGAFWPRWIATRGDMIYLSDDEHLACLDATGAELFLLALEDYVPSLERGPRALVGEDRELRAFALWRDVQGIVQTGLLNFDAFPSGTYVISDPIGLTVTVNGTEHTTPCLVPGAVGSQHQITTRFVQENPGQTRDRFVSWSQGEGAELLVSVDTFPRTVIASFERSYYLAMESSPGGVVSPASGYYPAGSVIDIEASSDGRFTFMEWTTPHTEPCLKRDPNCECWLPTGYNGLESSATIYLTEPTTQYARFSDQGYEFLLSASPTDPYVQVAPPLPGQVRKIHLWGTCLRRGLAALEASITGTMNVVGFEPAEGVLNVFDGRDLLLAIGGCPSGSDANFRLGSFITVDSEGGSEICLGPSVKNQQRVAVDCEQFQVAAWDFVVRGFSSTGNAPCVIGTNGCGEADAPFPFATDFTATPGLRRVNLTWNAPDVFTLGFHVYRGPADGVRQRISPVVIEGIGDLSFSDTDVQELTTYEYYLEARTSAESEMLGPVVVTTSRFPRLAATVLEVGPNPFRGTVTFSFALPQEDRVRVAIYDVTGRLVRDLANEPLPAGRHTLKWDGRSGDGAPVPAGVYFSRAEFGPQRETRRLVYLGGR